MSHEIELALRKQRLLLRSAQLRVELAGHAAGAAPVLVVGDRLLAGARWLRRHPVVAVAAAGVLLALRPRPLLRWTRRGVVAWQAWRRVRTWVDAHVHSIP